MTFAFGFPSKPDFLPSLDFGTAPATAPQLQVEEILNKSILIADDDERMLRALDKVLTGEGAMVTATQWAGDAIEVLMRRDQPIDLVITDLRMPLLTGMTLVHAIHRIFPKLPVIVLTAFGNQDLKAESLRQGAAAFLEKPLDSVELLTAIEIVFAATKTGENAVAADHAGDTDSSSRSKIKMSNRRVNRPGNNRNSVCFGTRTLG